MPIPANSDSLEVAITFLDLSLNSIKMSKRMPFVLKLLRGEDSSTHPLQKMRCKMFLDSGFVVYGIITSFVTFTFDHTSHFLPPSRMD